jgi:hypothetical protein
MAGAFACQQFLVELTMSDDNYDDFIDTGLIQLDFWETELLDQLKEFLGRPPTEEFRPELTEVVSQLFTLLPLQFDAKTCEEDYLQEVLDEFPNWQAQVKTLQMEQAFLYEDLREIRDQLRDGAPLHVLFPVLAEWIERLYKHEAEEHRLSQLAVNLDLGGPGH